MGAPVRSILVAGGGVEGWFAALTLVRRLPGVGVTVLEEPDAPPHPGDLYVGTRPGARRAFLKLGLDDSTLLAEAGGAVRLGQRYDGWAGERARFLHCFGRYGVRVDQAPFHQAWLRAARHGEAAPLEQHSTAAMMVEAGRIAAPSDDEYSPLTMFDYGLNLDPEPLRHLLRTRALAGGVQLAAGRMREIERAGTDRIATVRLEDGRALSADLFVDCTGPLAKLISEIDLDAPEDWHDWLPADRLLAADARAPGGDLPLVDTATFLSNGWRLQVPLVSRTLNLLAYDSSRMSDGRAARLLRTASGGEPSMDAVAMPQGRRRRFWVGNCVAVGHAAVTLEPLGAPGLHLLTQALDRLLRFMPDTDFSPIETREYDRKIGMEADLVRDFVILHHLLAAERRGGRLNAEPSPMLSQALALFRARGKIPGREGETAELDDWVAVLLGHGIMPDQLDPFLDAVPRSEFVKLSAAIRAVIADAVVDAPDHRTFLTRFTAGR